MDILPINFKVLHFCGAWKEGKDDRAIIQLMNIFYRYSVVGLVFYFTLMELAALVFIRGGLEDVTESLFMCLTYVALCLKFVNFLVRQDELSILLDCFRTEICRPKNIVERTILSKYEQRAKWCALSFMSLSLMTVIVQIVVPLISINLTERIFPVRTYIPYSVERLNVYLATYLMHAVSIIFSVLLNVSFDSLVYGLTLCVCGQIDVLCYRCTVNFKDKCTNEINHRKSMNGIIVALRDCVQHHVFIYELVSRIQSLFVWTVGVLFFFSLIILCTSIFQMSKTNMCSIEFLSLILYLSAMLYQVFFYCWYGNELQLKSKSIANAIYNTNWMMLSVQKRRNLRILMMIGQKELIISYHRIFALDLNTFTWIMKTSYSAFNILQQMSE